MVYVILSTHLNPLPFLAFLSLRILKLTNWLFPGSPFLFENWDFIFLLYIHFLKSFCFDPSSRLGNSGNIESLLSPWFESNGIHKRHSYNSSSNSNSSSIGSISSSSSDSDTGLTTGAGELEADADSVACRQSGLSTNDQFENDGRKMVWRLACSLLWQ